MHLNPRKILPVVVLAILAVAVWWYLDQNRARADEGNLYASGTIEATQVIIAPELGGNVVQVPVQEGDTVKAGELLVKLDDSRLQAQLKQAQAALSTAQANYGLVATGPTTEQRQLAIASAELQVTNAQQDLDNLYKKAELAKAQAQQAVAQSRDYVDKAERRLEYMNSKPSASDLEVAEATVAVAEKALKKVKQEYASYQKKPESNTKRAVLRLIVALAQQQYDLTVRRLNYLEGTPSDIEFAKAKADLALAQAQLEDTQRHYDDLKSGPDPDALALAQDQLKTAKAQLAAAQAGPSPEQLAVAQAQVDSAQAGLGVIQAQLEKMTLTSPTEGVVLARSVQPGEMVMPGAQLLTLGRLDDLTITIYLPEDRYGVIHLGQAAQLTVDSFPSAVFQAQVIYIASQAEFTPRNVQTVEGRSTTVFAVKLSIDNVDEKLKPGMPADVTFEN